MKKIKALLVVVCTGVLLTACGNPSQKGVEYLEDGKYDQAIEQFEQAVDKKKNVGDAHRGIGIAKWEKKDYKGARKAFKKVRGESESYKNVKLPVYVAPDYLLVDGYNIIFAWDELNKIAKESLDAARGQLINMMCNYQGYAKCELILVFDAYKVKGLHRDIEKYCNIFNR